MKKNSIKNNLGNSKKKRLLQAFRMRKDTITKNLPQQYNLQKLFLSILLLITQTAYLCKKHWQKLTQNALNTQLKHKRLFYVFSIGLFNFFASTPLSFIFILPITFGTLLYILHQQKTLPLKTQLLTIFFFLFGHFVSIFWWFIMPLFTDISHLFILIPLALLALPFIISLCFMPVFAILLYLWKKIFIEQTLFTRLKTNKYIAITDLSDLCLFVLFLVSWLCGDLFRSTIPFGGFPWMLFGHFVPYSFAIQPVRLIGIDLYSICFLALVLTPYFLFFKKDNCVIRKISIIILAGWGINCLLGLIIILLTPTTKFKQNILTTQINYPASLDMSTNATTILQQNLDLIYWNSRSPKETIIVMPESTINFDLQPNTQASSIIGKHIPNEKSILIAGGIYWDYNGLSPYNVAYAIDQYGHIVDLYKKQKLVPFGEYIPFRKYFPTLVRTITGGMIDFINTGEHNLYIFHRDLPLIYPIICYESIFPNYIKNNINISRKRFAEMDKEYMDQNHIKNIAERGEVIVNLTNDAWIKWSFAPYQHFLMTRFLAVATGIPVIRASNNGISAIIDKTGVVIQKTGLNKQDLIFLKGTN